MAGTGQNRQASTAPCSICKANWLSCPTHFPICACESAREANGKAVRHHDDTADHLVTFAVGRESRQWPTRIRRNRKPLHVESEQNGAVGVLHQPMSQLYGASGVGETRGFTKAPQSQSQRLFAQKVKGQLQLGDTLRVAYPFSMTNFRITCSSECSWGKQQAGEARGHVPTAGNYVVLKI